MNGNNFVIVAYAIGLGLLWGYAALLWLETKSATRREKHAGGQS